MMRLRLPALIILLVVVAAACSTPPLRDDRYLNDNSLLSDTPCSTPCWLNIIPGETSMRDARIVIEDDGRFTALEEIKDEASERRLLNFQVKDGLPCCQIYSTEDGKTVETILTYLAPDQVTLGQLIEKYGEPTYGIGVEATAEEATVAMFYPDVPLVAYAFVAGLATGELTANSEVILAVYLTADGMADIIAGNDLYAWEGYQKLADWLDGNFDHRAEITPEVETE